MAEVRLAIAQRVGGFNKLLVLKILREELAGDQEFMTMFLAEARVAALLNHPNIVQTNEVGVEDGRHFIAMEYLEGQPLSAVLARVGRTNVPLDAHVYVLTQMLIGLNYAHSLTDLNGAPLTVIHRDVSPQNVFVTYSGQVKLLDFGIAKIAGAVGLTKEGVLKGKIGYMAPEQGRMQMNLDRRADIFSVGVMLWEAIAQQRFVPSGEPEILALQRRLADEDPKLLDVAPNADPTLVNICNRALAFDREKRWQDAQSFADALEAWLPRPKAAIEKELARLVTERFEQERTSIRRIVEEESAKPFNAAAPSSANLREVGSPIETTPAVTGNTEVATKVATTVPLVVGARSQLKQTLTVALLAATVLGVVAGVGFVDMHKQAPPPAEKVEASAATPMSPVSEQIAIRVRAVPSIATFTIDDGRPQSVPHDSNVVKDEGRHKLRISADGYESEERVVSFKSDVEVDVTLRRVVPPADAANTAVTAKASPPQVSGRPKPPPSDGPTTPTPRPSKLKYELDETDPYAPK